VVRGSPLLMKIASLPPQKIYSSAASLSIYHKINNRTPRDSSADFNCDAMDIRGGTQKHDDDYHVNVVLLE
jgi:hypothetical protein